MRLPGFVDFVPVDGLKRILRELDQKVTMTKPQLVKKVLEAATDLPTSKVLGFLGMDSLKGICRGLELPVGGTKPVLIKRINSFNPRVVSFESVVKDMRRWRPPYNSRQEVDYYPIIQEYLEDKCYKVRTTKRGKSKPDLVVEGNPPIPIEVKRDLSGEYARDHAVGQLIKIINEYKQLILIVVEYYSNDKEDANEAIVYLTNAIPDFRDKCPTFIFYRDNLVL